MLAAITSRAAYEEERPGGAGSAAGAGRTGAGSPRRSAGSG